MEIFFHFHFYSHVLHIWMLLLWLLLVWSHFNNKYLLGFCLFRGYFPNLWLSCAFWGVLGLCGLYCGNGIDGMESLACFSSSLNLITHYDVWFVWYTWDVLHLWFVVVLTFGDFFCSNGGPTGGYFCSKCTNLWFVLELCSAVSFSET